MLVCNVRNPRSEAYFVARANHNCILSQLSGVVEDILCDTRQSRF